MPGMNDHNGTAIEGMAHIHQSVADILTTPIGTRVMRRDYGSLIPDLIDQPLTEANFLRLYAATVIALTRWEPRIHVDRVRHYIDNAQQGRAELEIEATTVWGDPLRLEVAIP